MRTADKHRRIRWTASAVAFWSWLLNLYGPFALLFVLHRSTGWPLALISSAVTLHFLVGAAGVMALPRLHRRMNAWATAAIAVVLSAVGIVCWSNCYNAWQLIGVAIISGLGWALGSTAAICALIAYLPANERTSGLAVALNGATVAGIVGPALWLSLFSAFGTLCATLLVAGAACVALLPMLAACSIEGMERNARLGELSSEDDMKDPGFHIRVTSLAAWRDPRVLYLLAAFAIASFAQIGVSAHLLVVIAPIVDEFWSPVLVGAGLACAIAGRQIVVLLERHATLHALAATCFALMAVGTAALACSNSIGPLTAAVLAIGLASGAISLFYPLICHRDFRAHDAPRIIALIAGCNQFALALAPATIGLLYDAAGKYDLPLLVAAGLHAISAMLLLSGRIWRSPTTTR